MKVRYKTIETIPFLSLLEDKPRYLYLCTLMPRKLEHQQSKGEVDWYGGYFILYSSARLAKRATLRDYKEHFGGEW